MSTGVSCGCASRLTAQTGNEPRPSFTLRARPRPLRSPLCLVGPLGKANFIGYCQAHHVVANLRLTAAMNGSASMGGQYTKRNARPSERLIASWRTSRLDLLSSCAVVPVELVVMLFYGDDS